MTMSPRKKRIVPEWMKKPGGLNTDATSVKTANSILATSDQRENEQEKENSGNEKEISRVTAEESSTNNQSVDCLSESDTDHEEIDSSINVSLKVVSEHSDSAPLNATRAGSVSDVNETIQDDVSDSASNGCNSRCSRLDVSTKGTPALAKADSSSRESCKYGSSCYRKNPQHRKDFAHPGDSDYVDPASTSYNTSTGGSDDNRPLCEYGNACYRKNPQHRRDYRHDAPKKRKARPVQIQDIASDEDGDFNQSMGSDDFSPEESESDDSFVTSDSADSGNSDYDPEDDEIKKKKKIVQKKKRAKKD